MTLPVETGDAPSGSSGLQIDARPLTRRLLVALDEAGVRCCLLRPTAGGGDVDMLVDTADQAAAVAVMARHRLLRLAAYGRGTHAFYLGLDRSTGSWVEFDLVTELTFGRHCEIRTAAAAACLARRHRQDGIWVLGTDDEFWTLLLHCLLDKGGFAERHVWRLKTLAPLASLDSPLVRAMPPRIDAAALLAHARAGRVQALTAASLDIRRAWWRAQPATVAPAYLRAAALRLVERPLQAWSRRGPSVAVLGPDGAGKSTLAAGLESRFYFPVRRVYMGLWPSRDAADGPFRTAMRVAQRPFLAWWRYIGSLRHRALGRAVVFDRYVYDARLPPRGSLLWLKRLYFWVLSRACPAPRMAVLLDAPGEVMYARSGEYDPVHLEAERRHYVRLATRIPRLVRVDADRPPDEVLRDAVSHLWEYYRRRAGR